MASGTTVLWLMCVGAGLGDAAVDEWTQLTPAGTRPSKRSHHVLVAVEATGRLLLHGGSDQGSRVPFGDLWAYDAVANSWEELSPAGARPSARSGHAAVADGTTLYVQGGYAFFDGFFGDTWAFGANTWQQLASGPPVFGHVMALDEAAGAILVHGGRSRFFRYESRLWAFASGAWNELAPGGEAPSGRHYHGGVMDQTRRTLLVHGGNTAATDGEALWAYDVSANSWAQLAPAGARPASRYSHTLVLDQTSRKMLLHGGYTGGNTRLADFWVYDIAAESWTELSPAGARPSARHRHVAAVDPTTRAMLLHGGADDAYYADLWSWPLGTTSTTTTTTSTTTTTTSCPSGSVAGPGPACEQCTVGRFVADAVCEACPPGRSSAAGSTGSAACLPTLALVVAGLDTPELTASRDSAGVVDLHVTIGALPPAVFEAVSFQYAVDVAPLGSSLTGPESACTALWQEGPTATNLRHTYSQFFGPCKLNVTTTGANIFRQGVAGVYLMAVDPHGTEVRRVEWYLDIVLSYSPLDPGVRDVVFGTYPSMLEVFTSENFTEVGFPYFNAGDLVHLEQRLHDVLPSLELQLVMVWLSSSGDPADAGSLLHNLTGLPLTVHDAGASRVRATFAARPCNACYLHCLSRVVSATSAPLDNSPQYSVQSVYVEMAYTVTTTTTTTIYTILEAVPDDFTVGAYGTTPTGLLWIHVAVRVAVAARVM